MRINTTGLRPECIFIVAALLAEPVCGGDGADDDADTNKDNNNNDNDDDDPTSKRIKALEEEKERHYRHRKEAESKAASTAAELEKLLKWKKELEDKDKSETERLQAAIAEREKTQAELESRYTKALLENAFYRVSDIDWHNPARVFSMLDLSSVLIKDGVVDEEALKKKLEDLAKKEPYLVNVGGKKLPKTGNPPKEEKEIRNKSTDIKALAKKYPSLRGRIRG